MNTVEKITIVLALAVLAGISGRALIRQGNAEGDGGLGTALLGLIFYAIGGMFVVVAGLAWWLS